MSTKKKGSSKKSKKAARKRRRRIILFTCEVLILAALGIVLWFVIKGTRAEKIDTGDSISSNEEVKEHLEQAGLVDDVTSGSGIFQIALFGVDSREGELSKNTRTDTIMIASIDLETKDVKLISVYRDTFLNLGTDSYDKCNAAYAYGGPQQAISMLNINLDLDIQNYITVGFKGVVEAVDAVGGVNIDIASDEIGYLNDYQYCICEDLNRMNDYIPVSNTGYQLLDGLQALGYCRIRYTAGDDYKRTERQRNVLIQMVERSRNMSVSQINDIATATFSNISTNMDLDDILDLASHASEYNVIGSEGFPFADYRVSGNIGPHGSCVVPTDLVTNVELLHNYLFGEDENYEPTPTVVSISDSIASQTAPYVGY